MTLGRPVRVVHLISGLGVGGAERALARVVATMDRARYDNSVVSLLEEGPIADQLRGHGIAVHCLNMPPGRPSLTGMYRAVRLLRQLRPDVLQTWLYHADLLGTLVWPFIGARALAWNVRASNVGAEHMRPFSRVAVGLCIRASGVPRAIVVNSEAGKAHHMTLGYRARSWVVIPNGIDPDEYVPSADARADVRRELGLAPDTLLIGLIARFDPLKDHETFLRAAALLSPLRPDVRFVLVGEGVTRSHAAFAALLDRVAPGVPVIPVGRRADVARLAAALDLSTCSSITEGFPNVVIESMACGIPCVVTDVGDAASIVGDTGAVVAPRDPDALCRAWETLLAAGSSARAALGQAARARVLDRYALKRTVRSYETLYDSLASA